MWVNTKRFRWMEERITALEEFNEGRILVDDIFNTHKEAVIMPKIDTPFYCEEEHPEIRKRYTLKKECMPEEVMNGINDIDEDLTDLCVYITEKEQDESVATKKEKVTKKKTK